MLPLLSICNPAQATSFTILNGQTVTTTQTLNDNETGTIEVGGQLNTGASRGITANGTNININVAGSIATTGTAQRTISASSGASVTVINSGTLSTTGSTNFNVSFFQSSGSITNSGTISSTGANSRAISVFQATGTFSITNSGTLSGTYQSVDTYDTATNLSLNSGSQVIGDIEFSGSGNDFLTIQGGTTINADIDMGGGTDSVTFDQTADNTLSSNFSNIENATKNNTGRLTLTGNANFTGTTTINAGALEIGNGGTTGSISGNIDNNGALIFNRSDALSYTGVISGSGALTQQGAGTLILSGANTYSGPTTIDGGVLRVNGSLASDVTVNSGGTLGAPWAVTARSVVLRSAAARSAPVIPLAP